MKTIFIVLLLVGLLGGTMFWMAHDSDKGFETSRQSIANQTIEMPSLSEEYPSVVKPVTIDGMDCLVLYRVEGISKTILDPSGITCDWNSKQ